MNGALGCLVNVQKIAEEENETTPESKQSKQLMVVLSVQDHLELKKIAISRNVKVCSISSIFKYKNIFKEKADFL